MEASTPSHRIRFGQFEVDSESGELFKDGRRVRLQGQPVQVLLMLLEKPGRLVTREELQHRLWPTDTFVDFDRGLNAAIKRLRESLGDSADEPCYIETLPRRGYRFIFPVEGIPVGVPRPVPAPSPSWILRFWSAMTQSQALPHKAEEDMLESVQTEAPAGPEIRRPEPDEMADGTAGEAHQRVGDQLAGESPPAPGEKVSVRKGPLAAGQRLGPYEVIELLASGGMGEVYKARDIRLERVVALKILSAEMTGDPERLKRFQREARAASALNHPHIAAVYDVGEAEGLQFLVMEYVEGQTLAERISGSRIETAEALDIGIQICEALEAAHQKGVIHRDIKPANVMVTSEGWVKVLDFGLAKQVKTGELSRGTASQFTLGLLMGTVEYMSPEQALGHEVDHRTDLFSLGVVLYIMAAGRLPFQGTTPTETIDQILHGEPEPLTRFDEKLPPELQHIIEKCLEKDREIRYQSARDLRVDLTRLKRDTDSSKSAAHPVRAGWTLRGRNMMRWIAVAALLAVLIVPLWWYFSRQRAKVIRGPMRIVPFTALSGVSSNPRFSPDGKFVAFDWEGPNGDNWDIYVKQVGRGEEPFRLTRDPAMDVNPVWSPDGGEIAFVRVSGDVASIYAVPSLGGVERRLYESRSALFGGFFWWLPDFHGGPFSWSPDGHWLAFSEKSAVESPARIYLFSLDTRQKIALTSPLPGTWGDFFPEFSPDSKRVGFVRQSSYAAWDLWVQPVASGEATRLTSQNYSSMDQPAWTPDGNQLVFAASFSLQQSGLFRVPFSGGLPQTVAGIGANARAPAIWRNYMVFSQRSAWRPSLCRMRGPNYRGKDRSPAPLLRSRYHYAGPDYSPDGTRLTFYSDRSGFHEIWICNSDGTKPVQLTNLRKFSSDPRWSPDGRRVVFSCTRVDHDELYVIDAEGGTPRPLTNDQSQGEVPSWSRDGGWVYFASNRSGTYQVWKIPSEGGKAVQITKGGGFYAVESFDGKMLYYLKLLPPTLACGAIWKVPPEGGEETLVIDRGIGLFDWALRPEGIYFATLIDKKYSIDFLSFQTGKITPFYQEETPNGRGFFAISPDGEWFAYTEVPPLESDLMLVENFE